MVVGAPYDQHAGYGTGSAHVFYGCVDADLDGLCTDVDCDDSDDSVDDTLVTAYLDADGDGWGGDDRDEACAGGRGLRRHGRRLCR